jgi:hypothetical protein
MEAARGEEARLRADIHGLRRLRRQLVEDFSASLERYQRMIRGDLEARDDETERA